MLRLQLLKRLLSNAYGKLCIHTYFIIYTRKSRIPVRKVLGIFRIKPPSI